MSRTVIIGSGVTGMAAALLLAMQREQTKSSQEICILEASPKPAPLLWGFTRKGIHFDTGFHCAGGLGQNIQGQNGLLYQWLHCLGILKNLTKDQFFPVDEEFRLGQCSKYTFPSKEAALLPSIEQQFGPQSAAEFTRLYAQMHTVLQKSPYTNTQCRELPSLSFDDFGNFLDTLHKYSLPEPLQQMLKARCLLYGLSPEQASFHDYALVGGLYFHSCHGIHGGGKSLAKAFLQTLAQHNISLRCKAKVTKIHHHEKSIRQVELEDGEQISCDTCIFTGHPAQLTHMISEGIFRKSFLQHIENIPETASAFMLFAVSEKPYVQRRAVYLLPKDPRAAVLGSLESAQPIAYVIGHGNTVTNAQSGFPLTAIIPYKDASYTFADNVQHPRSAAYTTWKTNTAKRLQQYLQERMPELGAITVHEAATASTMQDWIYGSKGSLYGMAHTHQALPILPLTRMQGLYLAGQNVLLPGILGGIVSAAIATGFATNHQSILERFRTCAQ